ncbi:transposase [Paraburkholderia sacchari]
MRNCDFACGVFISYCGYHFHDANFLASHKVDPYNLTHWLSCFTTPQHVSSTLLQEVDSARTNAFGLFLFARAFAIRRQKIWPQRIFSFIIVGFPHPCPREKNRESLRRRQRASPYKQDETVHMHRAQVIFWIDHEDFFRQGT